MLVPDCLHANTGTSCCKFPVNETVCKSGSETVAFPVAQHLQNLATAVTYLTHRQLGLVPSSLTPHWSYPTVARLLFTFIPWSAGQVQLGLLFILKDCHTCLLLNLLSAAYLYHDQADLIALQ